MLTSLSAKRAPFLRGTSRYELRHVDETGWLGLKPTPVPSSSLSKARATTRWNRTASFRRGI